MISKAIYLLLFISNTVMAFSMCTDNYLNNLYIKRNLFNTLRYDKNPSINYLNYLNNIQKQPIYSKTNLIKKTNYDDIFLNMCDHNISEFIFDDNLTKLIVKYNNGICKVIYNNNENIINKIINLHFMIGDNIIFNIMNKHFNYYCEE